MKKRIVSLLLLVCTLLSVFPIVGIAAEEVLPKDETPGTLSETAPSGTHSYTAYDALYVGADGTKTANGGSLIGLYTAFGDDASVDIEGGKWKNKMDATGATDAVLRDTSDTLSFAKEASGFGFHMNKDQVVANAQKLGLTLPEAWASLDQFTVEHGARIDAVQSDTPLAIDFSGVRLDTLNGMWIPGTREGERFMTGGDTYCMRWQVDGKITGYGLGEKALCTDYAYREAYLAGGKAVGMVASYTKSVGADGAISYLISYNTGDSYPSARTYSFDLKFTF